MELKELEMRLACNFASQLKKALFSEFGSALVSLSKPISKNQNQLLLTALKLNSLKRVRFFATKLSLLKASDCFLSKTKELAYKRRYKKTISQIIPFFRLISKRDGMQRDNVYPGSLNLHKAR